MEDKIEMVDGGLLKSRRRSRRLTAIILVFVLSAAALITIGPYLVVPVYMVLHDNFLGRSHPEYDGVAMHLSDGKVVRILAGGFAGEGANFYVKIGDTSKLLSEVTIDDLAYLKFRELRDSPAEAVLILGPGGSARRQSIARVRDGRVDSLNLKHPGIPFSAHREGPFLELPVSFERVEEVFGEPVKWNREKARWF